MHQAPGADPVGSGQGPTWPLNREPATVAVSGSVGSEVLELATIEGLAPLWAQGTEGGRCKRST